MFIEEKFIKGLLPKNYLTTQKFNGIYCYVNNSKDVMSNFEWEKLIKFVEIKYGQRFTDFNFIDTVTEAKLSNRQQFTIYLKP